MAQRQEGTTSKLVAELSPTLALLAPPTTRPAPPVVVTSAPHGERRAPPQVGLARVRALLIPPKSPGPLLGRGSGHYHWGCNGNYNREGLCLPGTWGRREDRQ